MKLTIEELKNLEIGDIVWIINSNTSRDDNEYFQVREKGKYFTAIWLGCQEQVCLFHFGWEDYGKTWVAYKNREEAERKGEIFEAPCKVGDTIYAIPSDAQYGLNMLHHNENNKVYEQVIDEVRFTRSGWYVMTCELKAGQVGSSLGENWFLTRKEAEKKLQERYNKWTEVYQHK